MPDGSKRSIKGEQTRTFRLERAADPKQFTAALSSELPVERWFGSEVLRHSAESVNMERASRGLPLLFNHDTSLPIGRARNVRLDGNKLRAEIDFSPNSELGRQMAADVEGGFLDEVSIRYSIDEYETTTDKAGQDTVTITRWTPLEASIAPVPADHTVGIGRSRDSGKQPKERLMDDEKDTGDAGSTAGNLAVVTELRGKRKADEERGAKNAIKGERDRLAELNDIFGSVDTRFRGDDFDALREKCIVDGIRADGARKLLLDLIQGNLPEQTPSTRQVADDINGGTRGRDPFVTAGKDGGDKMVEGISRSIEVRAGLVDKAEAAKDSGSEYKGLSMVELARAFALRQGMNVRGLSPYQMLGVVLKGGGRRDIGSGTEDFTGILANVSSKSLLKGWETAATTYRQWVRIGNLSDFKRANRTGLSGMALLDEVPESAEYKYGKPSDRTEFITAVKYGKLFSISREALVNDDLNAFTQVPMMMGRAADLTINKAVYDSLTSASGLGPTLNQDSVALFNSATHGNYDATSGGITVLNLEVGRGKMALQADPTNAMPLNIVPRYLLVPSALTSAARVLVASEKDPVGSTGAIGGATTPNQFYNAFTVISEAYLDGRTNGATAWYLLGDQNMTDTYEVGFLNGQQTPYLESKNGWDVDGVEYKVRIEAGVAALDYRGVYRKRGA